MTLKAGCPALLASLSANDKQSATITVLLRQVDLAEDVSFESGGTLMECHPVSVHRGEVETR